MSGFERAARDFTRTIVAEALLRDVDGHLERRGIPVLALKGIALALDVYPVEEVRTFTDVDVLVPRAAFAEAVRILRAEGFEYLVPPPRAYSATLKHPRHAMLLDLHGTLFSRGLFRLDEASVFARSVAFGGDLRRPCALDLIAHAIGHAAKTRPEVDVSRLEGDVRFARLREGITAQAAASHLDAYGMSRAARFTLRNAHAPDVVALREALPEDPFAPFVLGVAQQTSAAPLETLASLVSRHVLNEDLPRGLRSLAFQGLDYVGRKARALSRRR